VQLNTIDTTGQDSNAGLAPKGQSDEPSMSQRSFTALKWNYIGSFARSGSQFAIGIILARLLGPEPFGLVAVALLVISLGALIADFGLTSALVQRKSVSREDIRFIFTIQLLIGVILTLGIYFLAGRIAAYFNRPDATFVLQVMSFMFVLQALGQTAAALLRRDLDFKRAQLAQFGSYITGYVFLGMPMAFMGMGVWSLVIAQLAQASLNSVALYVMVRHPVSPYFKSSGKGLFHFGIKVMVANLGSWGIVNLDSAVIGRIFGVINLGLYSRAFNLVSNPMGVLVSSLQSVLFSVSARAQEDKPALLRTYLGLLGAMGFICFPMFFAVAVIPGTVINGVYGEKWVAAVPLLVPLALAMPFGALLALGGPVMTGMGRAGQETWIQFVALVFFVLVLWWTSRYSVEAIAWSAFATYVFRFGLITAVTLKLLHCSWLPFIQSLAAPLLLAGVTAGITFLADNLLSEVAMSPLLRLAVVTFAGGLAGAFMFALLLRRQLIAKPTNWLLDHLWVRIPMARRFIYGA
jgi:PST family polysaccharide transporter